MQVVEKALKMKLQAGSNGIKDVIFLTLSGNSKRKVHHEALQG